MSKHVDRNQVLKTTKVRTALKNDSSWIHKLKQRECDDARTDLTVETTSAPVSQKSYVLSTAKKFESVDSPPTLLLQKTSQGGSANPGKIEVIIPQEDVQPQVSTAETTYNVKVEAPAAEDDRERYADTAAGQSNVEDNESAAQASAVIHVESWLQNGDAHTVSSARDDPEAASPVEPTGQPGATAENKQQYANTADEAEGFAVPDLLVESMSISPAQWAADTATQVRCERHPPQRSTGEMSDVLDKDVLESSPQISAANETTPDDEVAQSQSPAQTSVKSVESEAALMFENAEEAVECNVPPVRTAAVERCAESATGNAEDLVMELNINDALEPVSDSEAGAVQGSLSVRHDDLTDVLDAEPPAAADVPEPVEESNPVHSEESKLIQSDDTNHAEIRPWPREEPMETSGPKAVCSFCDKIVDGNVKISISEPHMICHAECLKCGVCAKALGDMLTPMFLRDQVIHCDCCFVKVLKT